MSEFEGQLTGCVHAVAWASEIVGGPLMNLVALTEISAAKGMCSCRSGSHHGGVLMRSVLWQWEWT